MIDKPVCSCTHGCQTRTEMEERHGTPEQFLLSVFAAVPAFISVGEADAAVARYIREWAKAPRGSR